MVLRLQQQGRSHLIQSVYFFSLGAIFSDRVAQHFVCSRISTGRQYFVLQRSGFEQSSIIYLERRHDTRFFLSLSETSFMSYVNIVAPDQSARPHSLI